MRLKVKLKKVLLNKDFNMSFNFNYVTERERKRERVQPIHCTSSYDILFKVSM